jgi:hypothetical protein
LYADAAKRHADGPILANIGRIAKTRGAPIAETGWLGLR